MVGETELMVYVAKDYRIDETGKGILGEGILYDAGNAAHASMTRYNRVENEESWDVAENGAYVFINGIYELYNRDDNSHIGLDRYNYTPANVVFVEDPNGQYVFDETAVRLVQAGTLYLENNSTYYAFAEFHAFSLRNREDTDGRYSYDSNRDMTGSNGNSTTHGILDANRVETDLNSPNQIGRLKTGKAGTAYMRVREQDSLKLRYIQVDVLSDAEIYSNYAAYVDDDSDLTEADLIRKDVEAQVTAKVVAGSSHTLALRADNTIWAYGLNEYGQLGTNSSEPVR